MTKPKTKNSQEPTVIRLQWMEELHPMAKFYQHEKPLTDNSQDWGIYQIYGEHPVYGSDTLLYIGLCGEDENTKQTLGERISQHCRFRDAYYNARVYAGRLIGENPDKKTKADQREWAQHIRWAEKLLIFFHMPALNSRDISGQSVIDELSGKNVRVFNFGNYRKLLGEVSSDYFREYNEDFDKGKFKPYCLS